MKSLLARMIVLLLLSLVVVGHAEATPGIFAWGSNQYGQLGDGTTTEQHWPARVPALTNATAISSGGSHSLSLMSDGTVRAWGLNGNGQLGDDTTEDRHAPVQVPGLLTVTALAGGGAHSLALLASGTVRSWGANDHGQLGDDSTTERHAPVDVSGLTQVLAIAAGTNHSLALKADGTVWGWGANDHGQLGDETTTDRQTPVRVYGLINIIAIAAGDTHSLALQDDGTVWAWGNNGNGRLGDDTLDERLTPVRVSGLTHITAIGCGSLHSLALQDDGTVWAWGANGSGQLGDGTVSDRTAPVKVSGLSGIAIAVAGGTAYSSILKGDGTVWMCGANDNGQLGDGTTSGRLVPVQVLVLTEATVIAGKGDHALALVPFRILTAQLPPGEVGTALTLPLATSTGTLPYSWTLSAGALPAGLTLGGASGVISGTPAETGTFTFTVTATDANGETALKPLSLTVYPALSVTTSSLPASVITTGYSQQLTATGGLPPYTWSVTAGSLPDGLTLDPSSGALTGVPTTAISSTITVTVTDAAAFAASKQFALAMYDPVRINATTLPPGIVGAPYAWTVDTTGGNLPCTWGIVSGALPPGLSLDTASGFITGTPSAAGDYAFSVQVATGGGTVPAKTLSIRIASPSAVFTWGDNYYGQGGNQTIITRPTPVQVDGLPGVTALSGGASSFTMALKWDGTVWNWGDNHYYQLGDGTTTSRYAPGQVPGLSNVTAIEGGYYRAFAVKSDGTLLGWGSNAHGQLGNGSTSNQPTPLPVPGLTDVKGVSAGYLHTLATTSDGAVWAWGYNAHGQIGDGTATEQHSPVQVTGLGAVVAVAGGFMHSIALKSDGTVWTWGGNTHGQLGDGTTSDRPTPAQVPGLSGITAIAADYDVSIALKSDGTVWSWGDNVSLSPVRVVGLSGITAIVGGDHHAAALKSDGTFWRWVKDDGFAAPTRVAGLSGATYAAAGEAALALMPFGILTEKLPSGSVGLGYSQAITALSGSAPYAWSLAAGSLPSGLALNGATGSVTGTPTTAGTYTFTVQARDAAGATASKQLVISVLGITTATLPPASRNVPYQQTLAADGGTAPYTWSVSAGTLPQGLSIDARSGAISGTPQSTGNAAFTVQVADSLGVRCTKELTIAAYQPPVAAFTGTPLTGEAPLFVDFADASINNPVTWSWSFGDAGTGSQQNPTHVYTTPGTYSVTLTATNPAGSDAATRVGYITVLACANAPVGIADPTLVTYADFSTAYAQAVNNDVVRLQAVNFSGDMIVDRDVTFTLSGGYDCGYTVNPVSSGTTGNLRVSNGTVKVEKLRFI